jgi:carboxyl-terminal processing protease
LIEQQSKEIRAKKDDTKYNLSLTKFRAELKQYRDQNKKYEDLRKEIKGYSVSLLEEDKMRFANDTSKAGRETRWARNLAKDFYVHEATNVLNDLKTDWSVAKEK